jgi:dephospho-CoA kinase
MGVPTRTANLRGWIMTTTIAVTGPTGAGKSRFCQLLAGRGAVVVEADAVGHAVIDEPAVRADIVRVFGAAILGDDGLIDRGILGPRVFAEKGARERLDELVHPALARACEERLAAARTTGSPLVILEAAVYFLLPGPPPVDLTVTVTAPEPVRLARLAGLGLAPDRARGRMAAQAHLEPGWRRADRIIVNDGTPDDLAGAAARLWHELVVPEQE